MTALSVLLHFIVGCKDMPAIPTNTATAQTLVPTCTVVAWPPGPFPTPTPHPTHTPDPPRTPTREATPVDIQAEVTTPGHEVSTPTYLPGNASSTPAPTPTQCDHSWFFEGTESRYGCPNGPAITSFAAAQHFERGMMIWVEARGQYVILIKDTPDEAKGVFHLVSDPLTVYQDTSANIAPPDGLYAPESGFGLVWRGDVFEEGEGFRDLLGWALEPEFGYETVVQGGMMTTPHWSVYLRGPEGKVIGLIHLGRWAVVDG